MSESHYHRVDVPAEHAHKFTFAVVRNPYDRMMSMWRYLKTFTSGLPDGLVLDTPADVVRFCLGMPEGTQWWSQARMLSVSRIDAVLRYETIEDGLRELPFVTTWHPLPWTNETYGDTYQSPEFIALVNEFERDSFEQFGYFEKCALAQL